MSSLNHAPRLAFLACWAGARTPSIRPSGSVCVNSLCNALGIDLPRRRLVGARSPVAQGPDGIRPSATARNSAPSGQLVGNWTRMRAICSITRAPILISRSRSVANSQRASGLAVGSLSARHASAACGGVENEAHLIGARAVTRHAVRRQLRLMQLDRVFHLPALAVNVFVKVL